MAKDFLFELGTEELPPKSILSFANHIEDIVSDRLHINNLNYSTIKSFSTPRRLGFLITGLDEFAPDTEEEIWGPPIKIAFDGSGSPTKAAEAFADKNDLALNDLEGCIKNDGKIDKLFILKKLTGCETDKLMYAILSTAIITLPIPKKMRWGSTKTEFVRPIHWTVMLFGSKIVKGDFFGAIGNKTRGHRFHSDGELTIKSPADYEQLLEKNYVLADFEKRKNLIVKQTETAAKKLGGKAVIDDDLLNEVTGLVEWPVALAGNFDKQFLDVPKEALISSMSEHQKYFHVIDKKGALMPHFITIANIESKNPEEVINGNERVIRPRLADAAFFFEQDLKRSLESRLADLKKVVFQEKLGSIYEKCERVSRISAHIAVQIQANSQIASRAGLLCKADLASDMVLEFDKMQGIAGCYYANNDGEPAGVGEAIQEHYLPKQAGGDIPTSKEGAAVALADRLDTLVGVFGIGQKPTGSKDPFALRRAAIGALSIILNKQLDVGLYELLAFTQAQYEGQGKSLVASKELVETVVAYMLERFRALYQEQGIKVEVLNSVLAKKLSNAVDINKRVLAVNALSQLPEAESLAAANKRVGNILAKAAIGDAGKQRDYSVHPDLFEQTEETNLYALIEKEEQLIKPLINQQDYTAALLSLAKLKEPIDAFFDAVMVNADDPRIKENRLALLGELRALFLQVADISHLVPEKTTPNKSASGKK